MSMKIKESREYCRMKENDEYYKNDVKQEHVEQKKKVKMESSEKEGFDQTVVPKDEFIRSEETDQKPSGLYRLERDKNGNVRILFENLKKPEHADKSKEPSGKIDCAKEVCGTGKEQPKVKSDRPEKSEEKCIGNTDQVDREIKELKEKKKQLEQQIAMVSGDEKKVQELEQKLAQIESELNQKDNDAYRRQHTSFFGQL